MRVIFTCGGTGGHINPALAVAKLLRARRPDSEILFVTDYIVGCFQKQQPLLRFLAKNLSWGVFQETLNTTGSLVTEKFYDHYIESLDRYHVNCPSPDLMLFTMIELIGSTSYNCILHNQPVSMDEYRPYLHASLVKIREVFTKPQ